MKIGYIGLGRMGKNMVLRLLEQGIEVVAWNRSPEPREELLKEAKKLKKGSGNLTVVSTLAELVSSLRGSISHLRGELKVTPDHTSEVGTRKEEIIIWLMIDAGSAVDEVLKQLVPLLSKGDLIVDGANSFYKDTLRRNEKITSKGIHFMDIGVSGGPGGARTGACLMIGGDKEDLEKVKEVVVAAAAPDAWGHFGKVGAGHFAKMVHNGIEYGMMEAIGEGAAILNTSQFNFDLAEVFRVYNKRSVIESRLVQWTQEALSEDPQLSQISSEIKSTGEGEWTIKTARELGIQVPVIEDSFKVRQNSVNDPENSPEGFRNKVVSAQRGKFGQHPVKKS